MGNFKNQIDEDIKYYQQEFFYVNNIEKNEWAFNFWVLDKLFSVDEELIESKIVEYHDLGIDAYEIYEDTKEVYLIQNKYYSDNQGFRIIKSIKFFQDSLRIYYRAVVYDKEASFLVSQHQKNQHV